MNKPEQVPSNSLSMRCAHGRDVVERCLECETLAAAGKGSGFTPTKEWRCFHCDEVFTTEVDARNHFGSDQSSEPACQIKVAGEFALLQALRNAEDQLARYRNDDSDVLRAMWSAQADHATALRREEEKGYERGLRDAKEHPETLGLQRATHEPGVGEQRYQIVAFRDALDDSSAYRITDTRADSRVATCYVQDNAEMVRDALNRAPTPELAWRPIETAPKDGSDLLLAKIVGHIDHPTAVWWMVKGSWSLKWTKWWDGIEPCGLAGPTHWMPIPRRLALTKSGE